MAVLVLVVVAGLAALFLIPGSTPGMDIRRYPARRTLLGKCDWSDRRVEASGPVLRLYRDRADVEDGGERTDFLQVDTGTG